MSTVAPVYTDSGTAVLSIQTLALHANVSATVDLSTKRGAWLFAAYGRQGTTARTAGIAVLVRRMINGGVIEQPTPPTFVGDAATATRVTCTAAGTPNNAGVTSITTATNTGIVAGDIIFIDDTGNAGIGSSEWARVSFATSSTVLLLDRPTQYAHNSTNAHVSNHADVFPPVWIEGGCFAEVIFDDGASSTGDTNAVRCLMATYDSDSVT
jgi:hypothetical protein